MMRDGDVNDADDGVDVGGNEARQGCCGNEARRGASEANVSNYKTNIQS
jgi:hypothetical protein